MVPVVVTLYVAMAHTCLYGITASTCAALRMLRSWVSYTRSNHSFLIYLYQQTTARGERLKEATVEARRVIDGYRGEKEKQFQDFVKTVRRK